MYSSFCKIIFIMEKSPVYALTKYAQSILSLKCGHQDFSLVYGSHGPTTQPPHKGASFFFCRMHGYTRCELVLCNDINKVEYIAKTYSGIKIASQGIFVKKIKWFI